MPREGQMVALDAVIPNREKQIDVWREAVAQLRQLHGDVWNGVRFFLSVNAVLFAGMAALARELPDSGLHACLIAILAVAGSCGTIVARGILRGHRDYYLQMLLLKTLIEDDLGFYKAKFARTEVDMSFPWKVDAEYVPRMRDDPTRWRNEQRWRNGTISLKLRYMYDGVLILHGLALLLALATVYIATWQVVPT